MYCYEVWVRSRNYHGKFPLTYTSILDLPQGSIVEIDLKNIATVGAVKRKTVAPKKVAMKPIKKVLFQNDNLVMSQETLRLIFWFLQYYPASSGVVMQSFMPNINKKVEANINSTGDIQLKKVNQKLTKEQQSIFKKIKANNGSSILHGVTGSGKTRIYIELILDNIKNHKPSLVLVPEIGLVPHILQQISVFIGNSSIKTYHSGLTQKQKLQTWFEVLSENSPYILIGTRSALFLPFKKLGLIVVDECHDDGYKQNNTPIYHGVRVASKLAEIHQAKLIFGSATPAISDYYIAQEKHVPIFKLLKIANNSSLENIKIIKVNKLDKLEFTRSRSISTSLINKISQQLVLNQQSLLFLNQRGSAKLIICNDCGWRAVCKYCELSLTFHEDKHQLICHTCGFTLAAPTVCPECNGIDIIFNKPGTKGIESEIKSLFPHANIKRFDSDNLVSDKLANNFKDIASGKIDIIIGTQILVKGFDIPKLGLVGILDADSGLDFPDFTSEERNYQLISQAIGRVGRGHTSGTVIVQSLNPDNRLLKQAITKDWDSFYKTQIDLRRNHNYPPFVFLLKLECARKLQKTSINATTKLKSDLSKLYPGITILGPSPAFREKNRGYYSWQLIIKSTRRSILLKIIENLPSDWKYDIDPTHLL